MRMRSIASEYPVGSPDTSVHYNPAAAAISGGLGLVGSLVGADAQRDANSAAASAEKRRLAQLAPYREAGTQALPQYQQAIGQQPTFAQTVANLPNDPGYQFELEQGQKAIQGTAAAAGLLRSGRTLTSLTDYAQKLAASRASDAYTRDLNAFNNQQNQLLQLMNIGSGAAGAQSSLAQLAQNRGQIGADLATNLTNVGQNALQNVYMGRLLQQNGVTIPSLFGK